MQLYLRSGYVLINDRRFETRVNFTVERSQGGIAGGENNIAVYNLTAASRAWIENVTRASAKKVFLFAGYQGDNRLIFSGEYFFAWTERKGPDLVTTLQATSGLTLFQRAHMEFSGFNNAYQVYAAIAAKLETFGLVAGYLSPNVRSLLTNAVYSRPYADSGTVSRLLDILVRRFKLKWSVDSGQLNIYDPNDFEDQSVFFLSSDTGMVGFPSKTDQGGYKISSLLNPELVPGKKVLVRSREFKADTELKIVKLTHVGDTFEGEWRTELELAAKGFSNFLGAGIQ